MSGVAVRDAPCTPPPRAVGSRSSTILFEGSDMSDVDDVGNNKPAALDPTAVDSLLEMIGDDPEMVREIVDAFLEDAPDRLAEIATGLADGDAALVRRAAHTLKANGLTFGALGFAEACRELEDAAGSGTLDGAAPIAAEVERNWSAVRPAIEALAAGAVR